MIRKKLQPFADKHFHCSLLYKILTFEVFRCSEIHNIVAPQYKYSSQIPLHCSEKNTIIA